MSKCWCGTKNPYFAPLEDDVCSGTGTLYCYCGGDFCVCHNHGEVECGGCEACDDVGDDEPTYYRDQEWLAKQ